MKVVLFLCLISLFACKIDILETVQCLISKPKVKELGLKLFSYVYTKEYSKILPSLVNSLPDLYNAFIECLTKKDDEDIVLTGSSCAHPIRFSGCTIDCFGVEKSCIEKCTKKWC